LLWFFLFVFAKGSSKVSKLVGVDLVRCISSVSSRSEYLVDINRSILSRQTTGLIFLKLNLINPVKLSHLSITGLLNNFILLNLI
jgi:hypothetical protein